MMAQRIIVRAPNWIGDQVMALEFFRGLKKHYPKAYLCVVGTEHALSVLSLMPNVFHHHFVLGEGRNRPGSLFRMARDIRREAFDLSLCLPASFSSALLFFLAGVPRRVGFAKGGSDGLLTDSLLWEGRESGLHKSQLYLNLLTFLTQKPISPRPVLEKSSPKNQTKTVVVFPGANIGLREWPYMGELLQRVNQSFPNINIVLAGGPNDQKWARRLRRFKVLGIDDKIGKTSISQSVELCKRADLVITNDTGSAHLSATVAGARTLVLFGPGDEKYIRPLGPAMGLRSNTPCPPCESADCRSVWGYQHCLKSLSVDEVFHKVDQLLKESPEKAETVMS